MGQESFVRACRIRQPGHRVSVGPLRLSRAESTEIARYIGTPALSEWISAHPPWGEWLDGGRVRTLAPVAEKR
jgi:hypothetical protein